MAVGNTGEYLEQAADAMCTWLSRDGGATWQDVMPYAGIYECALASSMQDAMKLRLWRGACLPGLLYSDTLMKCPMPWVVHKHRSCVPGRFLQPGLRALIAMQQDVQKCAYVRSDAYVGEAGRYGDHGGLLIVTKHETEGPAESVLFSIDQGTCWHEVGLEEAIDVGNIRRAPAAVIAFKPGSGIRVGSQRRSCGRNISGCLHLMTGVLREYTLAGWSPLPPATCLWCMARRARSGQSIRRAPIRALAQTLLAGCTS